MPKVFISYSWDSEDHKSWVREFSARLRADGVDVILDRWHAVPGDPLPAFMEQSVRESDFVIIVCTPRYRANSNERKGGVGYEGDIITAEVFINHNHRKFIPILRAEDWSSAAPSFLQGKYYIDFRDTTSGIPYRELLDTLLETREQPPPLGQSPVVYPNRAQLQLTLVPRDLKNLSIDKGAFRSKAFAAQASSCFPFYTLNNYPHASEEGLSWGDLQNDKWAFQIGLIGIMNYAQCIDEVATFPGQGGQEASLKPGISAKQCLLSPLMMILFGKHFLGNTCNAAAITLRIQGVSGKIISFDSVDRALDERCWNYNFWNFDGQECNAANIIVSEDAKVTDNEDYLSELSVKLFSQVAFYFNFNICNSMAHPSGKLKLVTAELLKSLRRRSRFQDSY